MSEKENLFHQAIENGSVELTFKNTLSAQAYRSNLYYYRTRAALSDPRAMAVKISLSHTKVTLTFSPSPVESIS